jgi:hypothetical protein
MAWWEKVLNWFFASFDNSSKGSSARKLTAFALNLSTLSGVFMWCRALYFSVCFDFNGSTEITSNWATDIFVSVIAVLLCGAGFFLGLITFSQLLQFKNGTTTVSTNTHTDTSSETQTVTNAQDGTNQV